MKRRHLAALLAAAGLLAVASVALATTATQSQANEPQVAGDATSDSTARFPTNKQNEPTIAADPTNPSLLIAGSNDEQTQPACGAPPRTGGPTDCSFFPGAGSDGVYTSADGGVSWTNRGLLRGFTDYGDGGSLVSDGDPVIVFGPKPTAAGGFSFASGARAYYAGLASYASGAAKGNQAPELISVSTSDNDGATFSAPVVAASSNGYIFNDKEDIWADRNPASPFFGRVYVSWTQFRSITSTAEPVMVTYSADGGKTWAAPNQLSAAHNNGALGGRQGTAIRTGPDGTVYMVWEDGDKGGSKQVVAVSHDGGVTWSHSTTIAYLRDLADPIPGSNFRTDSFASLAVDQGSGAVYAAWADAASGAGRIVVARSVDGAATWSAAAVVSTRREGYAFFQDLDVAPGGRVDVGYQAQTAKNASTYGTGNAQVTSYYVKSTDGGASWSKPVAVSVPSDPAVSAQNNLERQFWGDYNTLVSTDASAWFIYTDARNGQGCPGVDAYQHGIDGSGPSVAKPAPPSACPAQFGNTDVFVSTIAP
jgi:hypothetical protein